MDGAQPPDSNRAPPPDGPADPQSGERRSVMALGVIVERRPVANPWASDQWLPVAVLPNAAEADWAPLPQEPDDPPGAARWHAATLPVTLYRTDCEAYLENLESDRPAVYVVLRPAEDDEAAHEVEVVCATLSPYEAQDFLDSGDDIVEPLPIPAQVEAWLRDFIARHHTETPFKKRKRKPHEAEKPVFGKVLHPVERPFYERRDRVLRALDDTEGEA